MTELDDGRYVGQQIRNYRLIRGFTQQQLADVMGLSRSAVTMYETGRRPVDSREQLYGFAQALQVSIGDLTGHANDKVNPNVAAFHAAVPAIESALLAAGNVDLVTTPRPLDLLVREARRALATRAANDYASLGGMLPGLLTDLFRRLDHGGDDAGERAHRALAEVCFVAASTTKSLGYPSLAWNAAQACSEASDKIGFTAGLAAAEFSRSQVLLATPGSLRAALSRAEVTADRLEPQLRSTTDLELHGMLHLQAGLVSAALGADPSSHLREAEDLAGRTGNGKAFGLHFGSENVTIWRMSVALEQRDGGRAVEIAQTLPPGSIPTEDRRSRFFIELGRAHALKGNYPESMYALLRAEELAPQKVRSRTVVRELVGHMIRRARRDLVTGDLGRLAKRVGAVSA